MEWLGAAPFFSFRLKMFPVVAFSSGAIITDGKMRKSPAFMEDLGIAMKFLLIGNILSSRVLKTSPWDAQIIFLHFKKQKSTYTQRITFT